MAEVGDFPYVMDDGCLQEGVGSERSGGGAPSTRSSERSFPEVVRGPRYIFIYFGGALSYI